MRLPGLRIGAVVLLLTACAQAGERCALVWTRGVNEHPEWCEAFQKAGFDSLTVKLPPTARDTLWWTNPSSLDSTNALLAEAHRTNLRGYFQIPLGMMTGTKFGPRTMTAAGFTESLLACPLNEEFWEKYLIPTLSFVARKSLDHPALKGVILDTEQYYGKERSGAINEHYCFCDACFSEFFKSRGIREALPTPAARQPWLESNDLLAAYWQHLEDRTREHFQRLAKSIQEIAPDFEIHFYIFEDTWFYRGLLKGLSVTKHPVFVFDGKTYNGFLKGWSKEAKSALARLNHRAVWVPGFYTATLNLRALRINIRKALEDGGSYWVYNEEEPFPFAEF